MRITTRFLDRPGHLYGRREWALRTAVRNLEWARAEGVRRLLEEHDLRPVPRALAAAERARWRHAHGRAPGEATAVFLSGVPRSGTNMIVRGLGALPEVEVRNEGDRAAFHRYRLREDAVVRDLVVRSRHRVVLLKPLLDGHRVRALLDELDTGAPRKALWAYRGVDGRVRSAVSKFGDAPLVALRDIAAGTGAWRWEAQGLSAGGLALVRSFDWERLAGADAAALVWYLRHRLFFEHGLDGRDDVRVVGYERLVREPEAAMQAVCRFVGVGYRPRVSAHIDARAERRRGAVALDPRIRALCAELGERLDAAAARP